MVAEITLAIPMQQIILTRIQHPHPHHRLEQDPPHRHPRYLDILDVAATIVGRMLHLVDASGSSDRHQGIVGGIRGSGHEGENVRRGEENVIEMGKKNEKKGEMTGI
jgi:hypothetical protein